jgi:hypothetical protein
MPELIEQTALTHSGFSHYRDELTFFLEYFFKAGI